jgi:membrane dipeptidase
MCLRWIEPDKNMQFADAHSDLGILMRMVESEVVDEHILSDFVKDLGVAKVGFSIVQIGGDFEHDGYDFRNRESVLKTIDLFQTENIKKHPYLEVAVSKGEIESVIKQGKSVVILSIEGSAVIDSEFKILDILHEQGLRSLAITHDYQNQYGCGCRVESDTGLTTDGERLLDHIAKRGIILDLVHLGEKTFWDAYEYTRQPVFVSHSNSKSQFDCVRNITDQQIRAVAERKGIIAVNFISEFLAAQEKVSMNHLIDHIDHVVDLTSVDNVALGPDFFQYLMPELGYVDDMAGPADLVRLPPALLNRGYSDDEVAKICHENLVQFMKSSL